MTDQAIDPLDKAVDAENIGVFMADMGYFSEENMDAFLEIPRTFECLCRYRQHRGTL